MFQRASRGTAIATVSLRQMLPVSAQGAIPLLLLLGAWQVVAALQIWPTQILVSPAVVVATTLEMIRSGEISAHMGASLYRLGTGFLAGATSGLLLGGAMALSDTVRRLVAPTCNALRQVPVIAFIPLIILFFDVETMFKVVVVAVASFFPVALATFDGVTGIPRLYFEVAALYRLPPAALLNKVVLPAAVPPIVAGMRLGLSRAWLSLVAAELLAGDSGVGQLMETGRQMFRIDQVMVGVIATGFVGFLLDRSMIFAEWRLERWKRA